MAEFLLDTNYLVYAFDETADKEKRIAILKDFAERVANDDELFLTPLIRYELLRGADWQDTEKLTKLEKALIANCKTLDISDKVADLARDLYRFDKFESEQQQQTKNLDKRKFDMFHYATAVINGIELLSADTDVPKIHALYQRMHHEQTQ